MLRYSPAVESVLAAAGWSPNRRVNIDGWAEALASEGYILGAPAAELLGNLGGLTVYMHATPPHQPYAHDLVFDPLHAGSGERDRVEEWEHHLGSLLFPVGYVTGACPVWVAETAAVYYGLEFGLYSLGQSFAEALERLLSSNIPPSPIIA